jgi:hypothetical protein
LLRKRVAKRDGSDTTLISCSPALSTGVVWGTAEC